VYAYHLRKRGQTDHLVCLMLPYVLGEGGSESEGRRKSRSNFTLRELQLEARRGTTYQQDGADFASEQYRLAFKA
jgi:hypothetical protein